MRAVVCTLLFLTQGLLNSVLSAERLEVSGPLCGVLSARAAVTMVQGDVSLPFEHLIEPRFLSPAGSSAEQLSDAVRTMGARAEVRSNMSLDELIALGKPAVLHVSSGGPGTPFDHWLVFLGADSEPGFCQVAEPPQAAARLPALRLQAVWDGTAVIVYPGTQPAASMLARIPVIALPFLLCLGIYTAVKTFAPSAVSLAWSPVVFVGIVGLLVAWREFSGPEDLIGRHGREQFSRIAAAVADFEFPTVALPEAAGKDVLQAPRLIDSRYARDFQRGSIPGAFSVPVNLSDTEFVQVADALDTTREYVIFCQSKSCGFSEILAKRLRTAGIHRISIADEGYVEWKRRSLR